MPGTFHSVLKSDALKELRLSNVKEVALVSREFRGIGGSNELNAKEFVVA
jgi:putative heme iron utilization protein